MTHTFTSTICFQEMGGYDPTALFEADCDGNCRLISVTIGVSFIADDAAVQRMMGADYQHQMDMVSDWWAETGAALHGVTY